MYLNSFKLKPILYISITLYRMEIKFSLSVKTYSITKLSYQMFWINSNIFIRINQTPLTALIESAVHIEI